ncbi:MAG: leucine-rich repeat domain-containing protein [Lachnospiraceae bacterium]|nr:leucine-rich repeat domain-containing protein [Lachnospiraceae bacterium]
MRKKVLSWLLSILLVFSVLTPLDKAYAAVNEGSESEQEQLEYAAVFPDAGFRRQICIGYGYDADNDGIIDDDELEAMAQCVTLALSPSEYYPDPIETLEGIEFFTGLQTLYVNDCGLKNLDVSKNSELFELNCANNPGVVIDLGNNKGLSLAYLNTPCDEWMVNVFDRSVSLYYYDDGDFFDWYSFQFPYDAKVKYNLSGDTLASMFPDSVFRTYVLKSYDGDKDGTIDEKEWARIAAEEELFLGADAYTHPSWTDQNKPIADDATISSLEGIRYFGNLKWLSCNGRGLTEIDISKNPKLERLDCADNLIEYLDLDYESITQVYCQGNPLQFINLGRNDALNRAYVEYMSLYCPVGDDGVCLAEYYEEVEGEEFPQFKSGLAFPEDATVHFNLSENDLAVLFPDQTFRTFIINWYDKTNDGNNDGAIDEREWANIETEENLWLNADAFTEPGWTDQNKPIADDATIGSLEGMQFFSSLKWLNCNGRGIYSLSLDGNEQLERIDCTNNYISMLDVSRNSIKQVMCEGNPDIQIILGSNDVLNKAYAEFLSQGCPVDDDGVCRAEYYEEVEGEEFPQFMGGLTFSEDATVEYDSYYGNIVPDDTEDAWYEVLSEYDTDKDHTLSDEELLAVTELTVENWDLNTLNGIERLVNLEVFEGPYMSNLVYADFSQNTKLKELTLTATSLRSLDLSSNTELTEIFIVGRFKTLNLSALNRLEKVYISGYEGEEGVTFGSLSALKQLWLDSYHCLEMPDLSAATELKKLDLTETAIESLDVPALTNLESLQCFNGVLEEITGLQNLTSLKYLNLAHNRLTSIDVSALTELEDFYCHSNSLTSLTVGAQVFNILMAGDNENLQSITGYENIISVKTLGVGYTGLESIDVFKFTDLQYLYCNGLGLDTLNLSANAELLMLDCSDNSIDNLFLGDNPKLFHLYCEKNTFSSLDITYNPKLLVAVRGAVTEKDGVCTYLNGVGGKNYFGDDPLANMLNIDADVEIIQGDNDPSEEELETIRMFPDPAFRNYVLVEFDKDFNCAIDAEELETIAACTEVHLSEAGVKDITGIEYFTGVENLDLRANELTSIDISKNVNLKVLNIGRNKLETLDITGIRGLIKAFCGSVQDKILLDDEGVEHECDDYSAFGRNEESFDLTVDKGVSITRTLTEDESQTISMFPDAAFRSFVFEYFDLNEDLVIDGEELAAIAECGSLNVNGRGISDLTGIEYFTGLKHLNCGDNRLESIDLSANKELLYLDCSINSLTELDISDNSKLINLDCSANNLTSLDISLVHGLVRAYAGDMYEYEYEFEDIVDGETVYKTVPYCNYSSPDDEVQIHEDITAYNTLCVDKATRIEAGIPNFTAVGMVLSDEIGLRFVVTVPEEFEFASNANMSFITEHFWYDVDLSEGEKLDENTYVYTCKLNPLEFADTVTAQIQFGTYTDEDMEYLNDRYVSYSISAEEYCDRLDTDDADESLRHLILSLREYACAVSQSGWSDGYNHAWIEADLSYYTSEEIDRLKEETIDYLYEEGLPAQIDLRDSGVEDVMISLSLLDKTILNIYVLPEDGVEVYGYESTRYIGGQLYYVIKTSPVGPLNLGKMKEIGINTSVGTAMIYACPLSYVYSFLCGSSNEAKNLAMISFFSYYKSACEYDNR